MKKYSKLMLFMLMTSLSLFVMSLPIQAQEAVSEKQKLEEQKALIEKKALSFTVSSPTRTPAVVSAPTKTDIDLVVGQLAAIQSQLDAINAAAAAFKGFNFGVALGYRKLNNCANCVKDAQVINGVVRVMEEQSDVIGFMLETHYYLRTKDDGKNMSGWGPFIAIDPGDSQNPIRAVGAGLMAGWRSNEKTSNSFNIGLGWAIDNKVTVLGDGLVSNQPLPPGETQVRYKKISRSGFMGILSYSF